MTASHPELRLAIVSEEAEIERLTKSSIASLFPEFYDERQTNASVEFIGVPDRELIEDGTYFVAEDGGELIAAGGWSKRDKLYTGSGEAAGDSRLLDPTREAAHVRAMFVRADWTRKGLGRAILEASEAAADAAGFSMLTLMATLPGEQLYKAYGFKEISRSEVGLPDGTRLECVEMEKPIS